MGGFGSFYSNQAMQNQQALPENLQPQTGPTESNVDPAYLPGGPMHGKHFGAAPGQPIPWQGTDPSAPGYSDPQMQQQQGAIYNPTQFGYNPNQGSRGPGYGAAWPGQGYGGMPGRFGGGQFGGNPYGGFFGGSMYGGGGSPYGYGPGSYSPWSAGAMGYGGGSGMMGGPQRPFTGFNYNNLMSQMMGGPMEQQFQPFQWAKPIKMDYETELAKLARQIANLKKAQSGDDRGGGGRGDGPGGFGGGSGGIGGVGTGEADSSGGNVGGTGAHGGCFGKGTKFKMADGSYKAVEDMDIGDLTEFGEVTDVMRGRSSRQWYDYLGTEVTDEHFVLEDGEWKYVKDSEHAVLIDPQDTYYTLNTEQHLLCGVNDVIFSDDAVFDTDHKPEWDEMLKVLNGGSSRTA